MYRSFRTLHAFLLHVRIRHAQEPSFSVTCGLNKCQQQFKSYYSYRKHIRRKHADFLQVSISEVPQVNEESVNVNDDCEMLDCDSESFAAETSSEERLQEIEHNFSQALARSVLKFREEHNMPVTVQNTVTTEMKSLIESYQHEISNEIKRHLLSKGYDVDGDSALGDLLDSDKQVNHVFTNIRSEHMLKNFCKSSLHLIEPQAVSVENDQYHFVSVCDVVKALLQNEDIIEQWDTGTSQSQRNDGYLRDYCDGSYFREHPLFSVCPDAVRVHLYIDEFEIANPIGANRGKHKMTAVYFTVGNLPQLMRSQQKFIFMALLVKHGLVKQWGYDTVLAPLVQDVKTLETIGITDKYGKVYRGAVATVSADNLSAHAVAGFRQSFSSGRICRFCMACKDEIGVKFSEEEFTVRTQSIHDYHVREVTRNASNAAIYGVCGRCTFSDLNYFSVTQCFPADIMHDCLEGVIPFVLGLVLAKLRENDSNLYNNINKAIASFDYSQHDKLSRPPLVRSDGSIIGSASQKWCMFRLLPFFLQDVPCKNPVWNLYCLLREILCIVFSPVVHISSLAYLQILIADHHQLLHSLFPDVRFTAKLHYMVHYPRLISCFGPLRNLWCMRFESKHLYFKRIAVASHNFINVTHTLATRHQFLQCYEMSDSQVLGRYCELPQSGKTIEVKQLQYSLRKLIPAKYATLWNISKCTVQHVKYARKQVMLLDYVHGDDVPVFVLVKYILYAAEDERFYLCGRIYQAVAFSTLYHAYEVAPSDWVVFHPGDEQESLGMNMYSVNSVSYVVMQHTCRP